MKTIRKKAILVCLHQSYFHEHFIHFILLFRFLATEVIVGSAIGSFVVVVLIAALIYRYYYRRGKESETTPLTIVNENQLIVE